MKRKSDIKENESESPKKKSLDSNEKRLQSLKAQKKAYRAQKSIIQLALSKVDKIRNKIIFDEDYGNEAICELSSKYPQRGNVLFEDESDNDNFDVNFSTKKQFEGEEGQKVSTSCFVLFGNKID